MRTELQKRLENIEWELVKLQDEKEAIERIIKNESLPKFIAYNAGNGEWIIEPFNPKLDWHLNEFCGTYTECEQECELQMYGSQPHYTNVRTNSIYDY